MDYDIQSSNTEHARIKKDFFFRTFEKENHADLSCRKWFKVRQERKDREWHNQSGFQSVISRVVTLHWCCGWVWSDWSILGRWTCGFLLLSFHPSLLSHFLFQSVDVLYVPVFLFECFFCLIFSISFYRRRAQALMFGWWCACARVRVCAWVCGPSGAVVLISVLGDQKRGCFHDSRQTGERGRGRGRGNSEESDSWTVFGWSTAVWK